MTCHALSERKKCCIAFGKDHWTTGYHDIDGEQTFVLNETCFRKGFSTLAAMSFTAAGDVGVTVRFQYGHQKTNPEAALAFLMFWYATHKGSNAEESFVWAKTELGDDFALFKLENVESAVWWNELKEYVWGK